eukprot:Phypoly_transcript_02439.p1 GENE.Phypoly_transcript_02439~~Phypoly_transcript_02439.p1  ORF type:complete len:769 (+),score=192.19 Phypoly_transcript_02439:134-2440(+)
MSIHFHAEQGDKVGVAQCIAARANVNEADTTGQKPLHYAAAKGFGEVVALLLQSEADPNSKSDKGRTPLHEAAKAGKLETVVLLLENKADPSSTDNEQKTPLHFAIAQGHTKVVSRLLEHGADINIAAKDGTTPLHLAALKGNLPLLCMLIEKGARIDARDGRGSTALASIPLAERPLLEVPTSSRKLATDIKSLLTAANGKNKHRDYDDEGNETFFSDVTFGVDGQQVHAHKNIVALRCPRLGKFFKNQGPEKVEIRDITVATFQALLEWVYSDDVANLRSNDPDVNAILSLLLAADRFSLNDLKGQCAAIAMRNISTANLAAVWADLRKCASASPDLHAYAAHLIARNWNVLASSKMAQDMSAADIVELCNLLTIGEVKEEVPEPAAKPPPPHRAGSPKRRPMPHASHPTETPPARQQPERTAHRHPAPPAAAPPPAEPTGQLPPDFNLLNIGNNNFLADPACRMEGKNAKSAKLIHSSLTKHKLSWPFMEPVDPIKLGIPNYRDIIKEPMDLGTIKSNLDRDAYSTVNQYARDVRLVFMNALTFNQPGYEIYKMSETLLKIFNDKFIKTNWETTANGDSYHDSPSPSTPTHAHPSQTKPKRRSSTFQTPTAPPAHHARAGNGHNSSPSPSPPPSPPAKHQTPREKAPPPPEEDMSYEDKKELGNKMHRLEQHQLSHVIQILGAKTQSDDDIEIDLDDVPADKLRILDKYVNECLFPNKQKRRYKGEDEEDVVIDDQEPDVGGNWEPGKRNEHKNKKKKYGRDDDE